MRKTQKPLALVLALVLALSLAPGVLADAPAVEVISVLAEGPLEDEAAEAEAQDAMDAVGAEYGAVFAVSQVELNGDRSPGNRDQETNLGNLITDAMRWSVLKDGELDVDDDHVVAITNGGGIRDWIHAGDVTMEEIHTVLPSGNTIAVVYVTGAELLEVLEASTYELPVGGFPQTKGIVFNLDISQEYDRGAAYPDSSYYAPASIRRVSIFNINGKDFDRKATYAVVTNNFCAAGSDTYYAFKAASAQSDTGIPMDEALRDYITEVLKGVIPSGLYGKPRGNQTKLLTVVRRTTQFLTIDGEKKDAEIYNINNENYFKLRDMAMLLNGTGSRFAVSYDAQDNSVEIQTGGTYTPVGGELDISEKRIEWVQSPQLVYVDGEEVTLRAYNVNGSNFFRLRDLGRALGFRVDYDEDTRTMLVESQSAVVTPVPAADVPAADATPAQTV